MESHSTAENIAPAATLSKETYMHHSLSYCFLVLWISVILCAAANGNGRMGISSPHKTRPREGWHIPLYVKYPGKAGIKDAESLGLAYATYHARQLQRLEEACPVVEQRGSYGEATMSDVAKLPIVWFHVPGQGWGNRIRCLASAYLFSILSGRLLLLDWEQPVPWSALLEAPHGIQWDGHPYTRCLPQTGERIYSNGPWSSQPGVHSEYWTRFATANYSKDMEDEVMHITGYTEFTDALMNNPMYKRVLKRVFGTTTDPLDQVFRMMLYPSSDVREIMAPIQAKMKDKFVVGLQIRTGFEAHTEGYQAGVGPGGSDRMLEPSDIDKFFYCAEKLVKREKDVVVFLATDDTATVQKAKEQLGDRLLFIDQEIVHSGMVRVGGPKEKESAKAHTKVVADWWLVAQSDRGFRTFWSTFGSTAWLLSDKDVTILPKQFVKSCKPVEKYTGYEHYLIYSTPPLPPPILSNQTTNFLNERNTTRSSYCTLPFDKMSYLRPYLEDDQHASVSDVLLLFYHSKLHGDAMPPKQIRTIQRWWYISPPKY